MAQEKHRLYAIYAFMVLWLFVLIVWKVATISGSVPHMVFSENIWWTCLLLFGAMMTGFLFQPSVKKEFKTDNPRLHLKDYETLMGYYWFVALTIFIGSWILSPLLYGSQTIFVIKSVHFWWSIIGTGILNVFIFYFFTKALRYGDISLVSVTQSFTPVITLPISFIIFWLVGEHAPISNPTVSTAGLIGILLTVIALVANIVLNKRKTQKHNAPADDWFGHHPVLCGIISTFFASIAVNFDKVSIDSSNPFLAGIFMATIVAALTLIYSLSKDDHNRVAFVFRNHWRSFLKIGIIYGATILVMNIALFGHNVNYYGAIKRTSAVFGTIYGIYVLKEGVSKEEKWTRAIVSIAVLIGVFLIALKG